MSFQDDLPEEEKSEWAMDIAFDLDEFFRQRDSQYAADHPDAHAAKEEIYEKLMAGRISALDEKLAALGQTENDYLPSEIEKFKDATGYEEWLDFDPKEVKAKHIDVSEVNGVYSITAKENDAEEIMKLLLPSAAYLPDIDSLLVELRTNNGTLSQINISGNGLFDDEAHTAYSISTVLTITEKTQQEIPAAVKEALVNNVPEGTGTLTDDLCRLLTGWQNLNETSPLVADISFDVDCGVLDLNEQLKLYRWNVSDMQIYSVQKNGYGLYFTENSICDSNGTRISAANAANVDTAKLLDILYTVCMNGSVQCKINDDQYTYVLALDEDGMAEVAYAIAPETKKLNITFISGSIRVVVEQEEIQCVEVSISGSVQVVLSKTDASITAALDFTKGGEASLPDAAKAALTGEK